MNGNQLRSKVLACFRTLHKVRKTVFAGDTNALAAGRLKINEEFRKNQDQTDPEKIEQLLKTGNDASEYLRLTVIQAELNKDKAVFEAKIRPEVKKLDNKMYDPYFEPPPPRSRKKKCK